MVVTCSLVLKSCFLFTCENTMDCFHHQLPPNEGAGSATPQDSSAASRRTLTPNDGTLNHVVEKSLYLSAASFVSIKYAESLPATV